MQKKEQGWPFEEPVDLDRIEERRGRWRVSEYKGKPKSPWILGAIVLTLIIDRMIRFLADIDGTIALIDRIQQLFQ